MLAYVHSAFIGLPKIDESGAYRLYLADRALEKGVSPRDLGCCNSFSNLKENRMKPEVYWIDAPTPGRLPIMPRPRAGDWLEDEIAGWRSEGIHVVVSLLKDEEVREPGLQRVSDLCRNTCTEFISFRAKRMGRTLPSGRQKWSLCQMERPRVFPPLPGNAWPWSDQVRARRVRCRMVHTRLG